MRSSTISERMSKGKVENEKWDANVSMVLLGAMSWAQGSFNGEREA